MVYIFDPPLGNSPGLISPLWDGLDDLNAYYRANQQIPAAKFPQPLIVDGPVQDVPDIFRPSSRVIVFSERARALMEKSAPGQVEFIPVRIQIDHDSALQSNLASAYYYVNVLGRAQRFQWLEMPTRPCQTSEDDIERFVMIDDYSQWKLRQRAPGEPLIWRESWWRFNNKEYRGHFEILIEDVLWQQLDGEFPNELNAIRVGVSLCPPEPSV